MDAAARPLPSEDTTPPVTRMNLMGCFSDCGICCGLSGSNGMRQQGAHALQVLARIDAYRLVSRFDRLDANAVRKRAQLLERFGALERCLRERCEPEERLAPVNIQTDVRPRVGRRLPRTSERDRRTREIHREPVP